MATMAGLVVAASSKGFDKVNREIADTTKLGGQADNQMSKLGKTLLGFASVGAVLVGVRKGFNSIVQEGELLQRNMLKTEQLLASTGRAADASAKALADQARALALVTLESTKNIMEAQQILMTFRNVGTDSFDAVTEMAMNLAAVTGGSLSGSMTQLAKVLDDPVKNLSAMARAGVSFSEAQADLIKELASTGRMAEAQGKIMEVLEGQYAGVARAAAGGLAGAQDTLGQRMQELSIAVNNYFKVGDRLASHYNNTAAAVHNFTTALESGDYDRIISLTMTLAGAVAGVTVAYGAYTVAMGAATVATGALRVATLLLNAALNANPIVRVVTVLAAFVGALVTARNRTLEFGQTTATVGDWVLATFGAIANASSKVTAQIGAGWDYLKETFGAVANLLGQAMAQAFSDTLKGGVFVVNALVGVFVGLGRSINIVAGTIASAFSGAFASTLDIAKAFWQSLMDIFSGDFAFTAFKSALNANLVDPMRHAAGDISAAFGDAMRTDYVQNFGNEVSATFHLVTRSIAEAAGASFEAREEQQRLKDELANSVAPTLMLASANDSLALSFDKLAESQGVSAGHAAQYAAKLSEDMARRLAELDEYNAALIAHAALEQRLQQQAMGNAANFFGAMSGMSTAAFGEASQTAHAMLRLQQMVQWASAMMNASQAYSSTLAAYATMAAMSGPAAPAVLAKGKAMASINFALSAGAATAIAATQLMTPSKQRRFGGSVSPGDDVLVGETGPEIIRMGSKGGHVVPNHKLGGEQAVSVTNVYQISTGVAETVQQELMMMAPELANMSKNAVMEAIRSGGAMSRAIGARR